MTIKIEKKEKIIMISSLVVCFLIETAILCSLSAAPGWTLIVFALGLALSFGSGWACKTHQVESAKSKPGDGVVIDIESK